MNEKEKWMLKQKIEQGLASEEEEKQYHSLIQADYDFMEKIEAEKFMFKAAKLTNDEAIWNSVNQYSRKKSNRTITISIASIAAAITIALVVWFFISNSSTPQLLLSERKSFYAYESDSTSRNYSVGSYSIGKIPILWYSVAKQKNDIEYQLCNDTLRYYLREPSLVEEYKNKKLLYDSKTSELLIQLNPKDLFIFEKCKEPKPISLPN